MENQEESSLGTTGRSSASGQRETPGVAYPLNRMVSLYYESNVEEWSLSEAEQAAPHAKHNEL